MAEQTVPEAGHRWSQTKTEIEVVMPLPQGVRGKEVVFRLKDQKLELGYRGSVKVSGLLYGRVNVDDATWDIDEEKDGQRVVLLTVAKSSYGDPWKYLTREEQEAQGAHAAERTVTHKVFLDFVLESDPEATKRVVIGLFGKVCPRTCENFRLLCTGERAKEDGGDARLWYKGNRVHKAIEGFLIEAGDVVHRDGTGGLSAFGDGAVFPDENFIIQHDRKGIVGMANANVPNSNASSFYVTLGEKDHLDNRRVAFGEVLEGMDTVEVISLCADPTGRAMIEEVTIVDCGELPA
eukprot:Rhum_TRINITY_DN13223_c0_g2::Rhum_TRINITY_DN13223_c0_g2_i1::g.58246::m.58246